MRHLLLFITMFLSLGFAQAQNWEGLDLDGLNAAKGEKEAMIDAAQGDIDAIQGFIDAYPGWTTKLIGTVGGNLSGFNSWFASENINSTSQSLGLDVFGTARYNGDKQFLYNDLIIGLGQLRTDNDVNKPDNEVTTTTPNKLNLSSLYGYKIMKNLALSAGASYNTAIVGKNVNDKSLLNNPGDLDLGIGFTWTPIADFYLMVHPINYHWKFGDNPDFSSALGAKIKAGYSRELYKGISWVSNLEGFIPYGDAGINAVTMEARPDATWYEWTNTLAFSVWKGIGVGLTYGIRKADAETTNTQTRYNLGLSYNL